MASVLATFHAHQVGLLASRTPAAAHRPWNTTDIVHRQLRHVTQPRLMRRRVATVHPETSVRDEDSHQHPAAAETVKQDDDSGVWTRAWWPLQAIENLDASKVNSITLMGREYVLWKDADQQWRCMDDRCPHRLAPLSDGFVDGPRRNIVCAYHGFAFQADGKCTRVPQATSEAAHATATSSSRNCVQSFPVREAGGLLFMWPDTAPTRWIDSAVTEPPLPSELAGEGHMPLRGRWYMRELPYSYEFFLENVLDPAHALFSHHGVANLSASDYSKFEFKHVSDGPSGFQYITEFLDPTKKITVATFNAPSSVMLVERPPKQAPARKSRKREAKPQGDGDLLSTLVFFCAPTRPGWCRFIGTSWMADAQGKPSKELSIFTSAIPAWLRHVLGHQFMAGDQYMLSGATWRYAAEGRDWRKSYYMPTSVDSAVVALRRWLDKRAPIPWPAAMAGPYAEVKNLAPLKREEVLDRYHQHTEHCAACRGAMQRSEGVAKGALFVAGLAAAGAILAAAASAQAEYGSLPGWVAGVLSTAGGPLTAAAWMLAIAAVALATHTLSRKVAGAFRYIEFDRPAFA